MISLPSARNACTVAKMSASVVEVETVSVAASGPVISVSASRTVRKGTPGPSAPKVIVVCAAGGFCTSRAAGVQVQLGPAGPGQRPLGLAAQLEVLAGAADVQPDRRL